MTDSPAHVRLARSTDAQGIADVHIQSWRETYSGLIPDRLMDAEALAKRGRMWTSILALDPLPGRIAVAERDGRVVGFAFAGPATHPDASKGMVPARDWHLYSIYLLSGEQGTGVGRSLLDMVAEDRPAQLWVLKENEPARAFYEMQGFVADGVEYVDPDLDGLVEIRMVR